MGRTGRQRQRKNSKKQTRSLSSDQNFIRLTKWMVRNGWEPVTRLHLREFPETGRGLMTKANIDKGDVIISIPNHLLITTATVDGTPLTRVFSQVQGKSFLTQEVLAVFLAWEKHLGSLSKWKEYISTLPESFSTPHFLGKTHHDALPEFIQKVVCSALDTVEKSFGNVSSCFQRCAGFQCQHCGKLSEEIINLDIYLWGWCCVNTRAVYIDPSLVPQHGINIQDRDCLALAPFLDMFNHSNMARVEVGLNSKNNCYEIQSLVPFKKSSEVFINYGPHSNLKLYTEYGFVIPYNQNDSIPLTYDQLKTSVVFHNITITSEWEKLCFLQKHELLTEVAITATGLTWNAMVVLNILVCNDSHPKIWENIAFNCEVVTSDSKAVSLVTKSLLEMVKKKLGKSLDCLVSQTDLGLGKANSENNSSVVMCIALINQLISVIDSALKSLCL